MMIRGNRAPTSPSGSLPLWLRRESLQSQFGYIGFVPFGKHPQDTLADDIILSREPFIDATGDADFGHIVLRREALNDRLRLWSN